MKRRGKKTSRNLILIQFDSRSIADKMSYDIKGTLYLEDGFVMDLQDIILHDKDKTHYLTGSGTASVQTCIAFAGLTFFRDFRFEADEPEKIPDQAIGGVILRPEKFYFDLRVNIIHRASYSTHCCANKQIDRILCR